MSEPAGSRHGSDPLSPEHRGAMEWARAGANELFDADFCRVEMDADDGPVFQEGWESGFARGWAAACKRPLDGHLLDVLEGLLDGRVDAEAGALALLVAEGRIELEGGSFG